MSANKHWWFFRLRGLTITNQSADLDKPIFTDSTLLSNQSLASLIQQASELPPTMKPAFVNAVFHPSLPSPCGFIAVARMVPSAQKLTFAEEKSFQRARDIAALMALCWMWDTIPAASLGLANEVRQNNYDCLRFSPGIEWNLSYSNRERIFFSGAGVSASREELVGLLTCPEFEALTAIVVGKSTVRPRMRLKITSALLRLASGIWHNEPESLLLAGFTSVEMLLGGDEGHDRLVARVKTLLGDVSEKLGVDAVTHSRHQYVHRGQAVSMRLGQQSIALGFATILSYSKLVSSLDKSACQSNLVNVLLDLSGRNPPVDIGQLTQLFKSNDMSAFAISHLPGFLQTDS